MPKNLEIFNFEQLLKHILRVFPSLGDKFNSLWLDHSGSQPLTLHVRDNPTIIILI